MGGVADPWEGAPSHPLRDPIVEDKIAKLAQRHNIICSIDPFDVKRTRAFRLLADFQAVGSSEDYRHWSRALRHRENMVRIAQNLVRMYELPEPQDCVVLEWQPTMSHYDRFFMPDRVRAICDEMDKYNNFPWRDINNYLDHEFKRPHLYLVNALDDSPMSIDEIAAWIKKISNTYAKASTTNGK